MTRGHTGRLAHNIPAFARQDAMGGGHRTGVLGRLAVAFVDAVACPRWEPAPHRLGFRVWSNETPEYYTSSEEPDQTEDADLRGQLAANAREASKSYDIGVTVARLEQNYEEVFAVG